MIMDIFIHLYIPATICMIFERFLSFFSFFFFKIYIQ